MQDVREETRWQEVIAETLQKFGGLHILVNNAGVVKIATPETCTLEEFRFQNAVMSEGVFLGCKHAMPVMKASGGGSIINMSSVASHLGYPVYFAYSAAKGAVRSMTKAIAVHCQMNKYNVRCNSIRTRAPSTHKWCATPPGRWAWRCRTGSRRRPASASPRTSPTWSSISPSR